MAVSNFDQKILNILDGKLMSIGDVAKETNSDRQFIKGILESLRARGFLKKTKVGRSIIYQVNDSKNKNSENLEDSTNLKKEVCA